MTMFVFCMLGNFELLSSAFFKIDFFKKIFQFYQLNVLFLKQIIILLDFQAM